MPPNPTGLWWQYPGENLMEEESSEFLSLQEAANEETSGDRLKQLTKISTKEARLVAKNPSAPPALLRELGNSSDTITRKNVAANPNTPTEVLLKLGGEFPLQLLDNPVFFLLLLENPNLLDEIPLTSTTLKSLLKEEKIPVFFLTWAANKPNREVQLAVTMNAQTPSEVLEKLVGSPDRQVAEAARLHVNWAGEVTQGWHEAVREAIQTTVFETRDEGCFINSADADIDEFVIKHLLGNKCYDEVLKDPVIKHLLGNKYSDEVLETVARSANNHCDFIERLARHYKWAIRMAVAQNPNTPARILEELFRDEMWNLRMAVAQNPNTPVRILEELFRDERWVIRWSVAQNPNTPARILEELVRDERWVIRWSVAQNPNTPASLLEELIRDERWVIRLAIARNPNAPVSLLEQLAEDNEERVRLNVAMYLNTPVSLLQQWAGEEDNIAVRRSAAEHPNTPVTLLEQLAKDGDAYVRSNVARNQNAPASLLEQLAKDGDGYGYVRSNVARNPKAPASLLEQLAKDRDGYVRIKVAEHPNIPLSVLEYLLDDLVPMVRRVAVERYLAQNPEGLPVVLEHYAKNFASSYSRFLVLLHPQIPSKALADNFRSSSWLERYAIAQHPNTPLDTLHTLAVDANRIVRAAAKANLQNRNQQP